jgi:hypothetical protein
MTSDDTFPNRLTEIDDLTRADHWYLTEDDVCYFLGEYTAREGFAYSATNHLILNFKKGMDRRGRPEWRYKERNIKMAGAAFRRALKPEDFDVLTFVPVPPSKAKDDPLYDDRITQMLRAIRNEPALDIRELVVQTASTDAVHEMEARLGPEQIEALYRIEDELTEPAPRVIAVVDDLLTTGAHFRAAKSILSSRFPETPVIGLFIARRAPDSSSIEDFDDLDIF